MARRKAATICPVNFAYRTKIYNAVEIFISAPFANAPRHAVPNLYHL